MEYYCNIYCNPRQDYFIKVDQLFQNESNEGKGVYNFTGLGSELLFWIFSVIRDFQKSEEKIWLLKTRNWRVNNNRYWTTVYFDWYFWAIVYQVQRTNPDQWKSRRHLWQKYSNPAKIPKKLILKMFLMSLMKPILIASILLQAISCCP